MEGNKRMMHEGTEQQIGRATDRPNFSQIFRFDSANNKKQRAPSEIIPKQFHTPKAGNSSTAVLSKGVQERVEEGELRHRLARDLYRSQLTLVPSKIWGPASQLSSLSTQSIGIGPLELLLEQ